MSDDYPQRDQPTQAHDFDETVRRPSQPRPPQQEAMARPVMPSRPVASGIDREAPEKSGLYVPWWGFALVILVVAGITCGLWGVALMNRGDSAASGGPTPTPIFVVITASPTAGIPPSPTAGIVVTQPSAGPTQPPVAPTTPPASGIAIGSVIVVKGTEGSGLTVRQGPGIDYTYVFVANEGEKFNIGDGPREANGYTWWYIVDPSNAARFGWAVQNFMQVAP